MKLRPVLLALSLLIAAHACPASTRLTFTLFDAVREQPGVALAPDALSHSLAFLYYGSAGETEKAFQSALFPDLTRTEAMEQIATPRPSTPGYRSISGLWTDPRLTLTGSFERAATQRWAFHLHQAPLQTDPAAAATAINTWFAQQTNGHVERVVTTEDLADPIDLVGVTVTAFVSPWKETYFTPSETRPRPFTFAPDSKADVGMMSTARTLPYGQNEYFQIVRLDYTSAGMSLLLLVPKKELGLAEALPSLTPEVFSDIAATLKPTRLQLALPKIQYRSRIDWREPLERMGLQNAFRDGQADFSRINDNRPQPLKLSKVVQDVWIRWDERGTEARASTSFSNDPFAALPPSVVADHPFAYVIYHRETLDIFFMGTVSTPEQMR